MCVVYFCKIPITCFYFFRSLNRWFQQCVLHLYSQLAITNLWSFLSFSLFSPKKTHNTCDPTWVNDGLWEQYKKFNVNAKSRIWWRWVTIFKWFSKLIETVMEKELCKIKKVPNLGSKRTLNDVSLLSHCRQQSFTWPFSTILSSRNMIKNRPKQNSFYFIRNL